MINEVSGKFLNETKESQEIKDSNTENFKKIKPEEGTTLKDAKAFWKNEYAKGGDITENSEKPVEKIYYDDNGEKYREEDNLEPNKIFEVNGYKYETDDKGRTISVEGKLKIADSENERIHEKMDAVGKGDQEKGDEMGHLIGHRFGGSGGIENLVPMDFKLNRSDYKIMENKLAAAVEAGSDVRLKVEPVYDSDSHRPTELRASYSIDGEKTVVVFKNESMEAKV